MAEPESGVQDFQTESVGDSLERLRSALDVVGSVPSLTEDAQSVNDSAQELAEVIDNLAVNRDALLVANNDAADLRLRASNISPDSSESRSALSVVQRLWLANNEAERQELWDQFAPLAVIGGDPEVASLGEDRGAFYVRGQQLVLTTRLQSLTEDFDRSSADLGESVSGLLAASQAHSSDNLA